MDIHDNNETPDTTSPVMKDKNGFLLQVGDSITCTLGKCSIEEYLFPDRGDGFGARVRVKTSKGSIADIALILADAEYLRPQDGQERTTTSKYGV